MQNRRSDFNEIDEMIDSCMSIVLKVLPHRWPNVEKKAIPWTLYEAGSTKFWVHYGLIILGFLLAVITFIVQFMKPAPYGKHESNDGNWGPMIHQRLGHMLSDAIPGVILFVLIFFFYGTAREYPNYVFLGLWLLHYLHRGLLHPMLMRYRNSKVALGITLGGFFPNCLFHYLNAEFAGNAYYQDQYYYDPRFIIGIVIYFLGYFTNRWADHHLRSLRETKGENGCTGYYIPYGGLFELVSCPNYFGELVEWLGWSIATWSLPGLVWTLFSAATFIPRAKHNHNWYKEKFDMYPPNRRALIPYIY